MVELAWVTFHRAVVPKSIGQTDAIQIFSADWRSGGDELLWAAHALNHVPHSRWDMVKAVKWTFPIQFSSSVFLFYPILKFNSSRWQHQNPSHKHYLGRSSGQQGEPDVRAPLIAALMGASIKGSHLDSWWFSGSSPELMVYCLRGNSRRQLR